jgi:hypothetical protein
MTMRSLRIEVSDQCGITREFAFSHADGDPAGLFLLAMAWGSATVHWPSQRTRSLVPKAGPRAVVPDRSA